MQFGEVSSKNHKNQIWFKIHFKIVYHFSSTIIGSLHFSIFRQYICMCIFCTKLRWRAKAKKYICRVRTYVLQSTYWHCAWSIFKRKFSTSSRNLWKDATKMQLMVWSADALPLLYIHINTNNIWTIRKRSVLEFLKRKSYIDFF